MRCLFSVIPSAGHFYPVVQLARALAAQGNDVAIATAGALAAEVQKAGLGHLPCGPDESTIVQAFAPVAREVAQLPIPERRPFAFAKRFAEIVAPMTISELVDTCRDWSPDCVVYDTAALAAPLAAAVVGARSAHHSWGPLFPAPVVANAARAMKPLWEEWGVEPDPAAGLFSDIYVDIAPPSMQFAEIDSVSHRILLRPEGYDGTTGKREVLDLPTGRPLIYVTFGTMGLFNGPDLFRLVVDALRDFDVTVLLTVGRNNDPTGLGDLPDNVVVHQYLPQFSVLPYADVAVTHGGAGSVLGAARHGCPALTLPGGADQFTNAEQHAVTGAGVFLTPPDVSVESVRAAVRSLLDEPSYRKSAAALAEEIAQMPDSAAAARAIVASCE
jgi:UDP:flavonoid glycosyltransferase YjiC (YdhE family)